MAKTQLFRPQAVENYRQRLYGEVVLLMPTTHWAVTLIILVAIATLGAFLAFGTYARKESVSGWIRPDRGLVRVQSQDEGVVESVFVHEGQHLVAGAPLMALRLDAEVASGERVGRRIATEVERERRELLEQEASLRAQYEVRESRLRAELEGLDREIAQFQKREEVLERRLILAKRQLEERETLVRRGFFSRLDAEKLEDAVLGARQAHEDLAQDMLERQNKARTMRFDLSSLPHERASALAAIRERVAALDQRATEAERRSGVVLTAPVSGRVSDVRVEPGEAAKAKTVLVDLIPDGAILQAELFAPSRAAGFLAAGTHVQLRYDAFPYQKFGVSHGKVVRVSRSTMDSKDLPRGVVPDEPVYRVLVQLQADHLAIDGQQVPLQAGMTLKADLILERRSVGEFIFAPLFGAARRG